VDLWANSNRKRPLWLSSLAALPLRIGQNKFNSDVSDAYYELLALDTARKLLTKLLLLQERPGIAKVQKQAGTRKRIGQLNNLKLNVN